MTTTEQPAVKQGQRSRGKELLLAFAHLAALSTFAIAQPLFDLLKDNPEFFAARGSTSGDIVSFSILLVLVVPLALILIEALVGLASRPAARVVHLVFVALLVALIAAQALKKAFDGGSDPVLIGLSLVIGALLALAYWRADVVRSFLTVLSPVPIVFLCLFLFTAPVSKLLFAEEAEARNVGAVTRAPIVMVLFDEFPSISLLDDKGQVDAKRYPAFAELAKTSHWFRNAYAVYDSTERAQPAIMDGNLPTRDKLPTSPDHPNSIFSLFGKTHRMNVSEEATSVCSRKLCKDAREDEPWSDRMTSLTDDLGLVWLHVVSPPGIENDLATVSENWGNFGGGGGGSGGSVPAPAGAASQTIDIHSNLNSNRNKRFDEWIANIKPGRRPGLNFKHTLLPHVPWVYLPDGKQVRRTASDPVPGFSNYSYNDQGQVDSLYQRHLLQLGFADHELGELIAHLKKTGQFDKSMIIVAADHGVAFDVGKRDRRTLTAENADEIAPIPLFMKAPGEKKGRISDAWVETIDILPTMFDLLNLKPPVKMDGHSAFSSTVRNRKTLRILLRNSFKQLDIPATQFEADKRRVLEKKLRLFGTGADGPDRIFRIGPHQELIGKSVSDPRLSPLPVELIYGREYGRVDNSSPTIPTHVAAKVQGGTGPEDVAIAINGTIRAVSRTFRLTTGGPYLVGAMVPERSFHEGANKVEVYRVSG